MQLCGVICVDKPQGFTSFDVVAKLRGILGMKKLGHSGTLDPMATGVLPVFAGNATKAISILPETSKSYRAGFRLGISTDTQDITGKILSERSVEVTRSQLEEKVVQFKGEIEQIPPMYSAVSVNGKRLYELARQGIEVERKPRPVTVHSLSILSFDEKAMEGTFDISCSKGTYVRTVIHDIGQALGCGGVMTGLVRTTSNGFSLGDCFTLSQLEAMRSENSLESAVLPIDRIFAPMTAVKLDGKKTALYKNGVKLRFDQIKGLDGSERYRVYSDKNEFLGIALADCEKSEFRVLKNMWG